jgi:phospholipid/cholesterol/gamma-HCH transport system substrate-binding protein
METKANHILIGAFILAATLLGFGFVFWIQNFGAGNSVNRYYILFKDPVTGLAPASNVLFNGLKVGRVESFEIDPVDSRNTKVLITIDRATPVRRNSFARVVAQGLTAYSSVMITPGTPDEQLLTAANETEIPLIKAAPGGNGSLFDAAPEVMNNVNSVLRRLDDLVANNEQLVRDTLKNVEAFTAELKSNKDKVTSLMRNADDAAAKVGSAAARIDKFLGDNEKSLTDSAASIAATSKNAQEFSAMLSAKKEDVAAIIDNVRAVSDQFKGVAGKLENALDNLSGFLSDKDGKSTLGEISAAAASFRSLADKLDKSVGNSADGMARFATDGLSQFEQLMREARQMVKTMERVLDNIDRNPQGLLFGSKQVREYKAN